MDCMSLSGPHCPVIYRFKDIIVARAELIAGKVLPRRFLFHSNTACGVTSYCIVPLSGVALPALAGNLLPVQAYLVCCAICLLFYTSKSAQQFPRVCSQRMCPALPLIVVLICTFPVHFSQRTPLLLMLSKARVLAPPRISSSPATKKCIV